MNNNEDLKRSKNVPSMRGKTTYPTIKFSVLNGSEMNEGLCADAEDNAIKGEHGIVNKREGNGIRVGGGREEREDESEGESVREREKNIDNEDSDTDIELGSTSKDEYCNDKFSLLTTNTNISSPIRIYKKIHKKYLLPVDENGNKVIKLPNIIEKNDEIIIEKNDEREYSDQIITEKKVKIDSLKPQTLSEMIRNKDIRFLSILYSYFCFVIMFVDESFPLWAVTSVQKGGLGWSSSQVGSALASVGKSTKYINFDMSIEMKGRRRKGIKLDGMSRREERRKGAKEREKIKWEEEEEKENGCEHRAKRK